MRHLLLGLLAASALATVARADLAISMNDSHTVLNDGNQVDAKDGRADTVTVIDLSGEPRIVATIDAPGSVAGPPMAAWIAPDESWAITTGATRTDAAASPGGVGPDDRVSVIDLSASPPKVVQTIKAGAGATTVRVTPDGTLALIANRTEGSLSVFSIKDKRLTAAGKLDIDPKSMPSGIVILPDGKRALLTRQADHQVVVLRIDGTTVTADKRPITTALAPFCALDLSPDGRLVAVGNMGRGDGDVDSVSLIDVSAEPFRTVQTVALGRSPEGLRWAPDGKHLAVAYQDGTTKPPSNPFYRAQGRLMMLALDEGRLRPVAEAPIGRWSQGIAFSRNGNTLLVQNMVERVIMVFGWDGKALTPKPALEIGSGPASIMTPWK